MSTKFCYINKGKMKERQSCSEWHIHRPNFEDLRSRETINILRGYILGGGCRKQQQDLFQESRHKIWHIIRMPFEILLHFTTPPESSDHSTHIVRKPGHFAQTPNCTKWLRKVASATEWLVLGITHYSDKNLAGKQAIWHENRWDKDLA